MIPRLFFGWLLVFGVVPDGYADVIYRIAVNTSSVSGTAGAIDINFNPGPSSTQSAMALLSGFTSNGAFAGNCSCGIGDVSGQLPSPVTIGNSTGFNDYFDGFLFGTGIAFDLTLSGPAVTWPDGIATSGSSFVFSMFSDSAGTIPTLTSDTTNGFAFRVDVNPDGTTTLTNFSPQTSVLLINDVPEPTCWALMMMGLVYIGMYRGRRSRLAR